jgi:hypothetical protein
MKYLLAAACLALASCASQRQHAPTRPPAEAVSAVPDEGPAYMPGQLTQQPETPSITASKTRKGDETKMAPIPSKNGFLGLFGRKQTKEVVQNSPYLPSKKCKGCTFNLVAGDQTNSVVGKKATGAVGTGAVASVIEKKAGPAQVASDSSTQNALLGAGNLAAVRGDGNTLPQTTTTQEAADWRAMLAKPAGEVAATALVLLLVAGAAWGIIAYKRRKALSANG